jgi:Fe-S cluster biogenesis protein NfuA
MAGEPGRLDGAVLTEHLARVDALLQQLEQAPGPTAQTAVQAVRELTAVYGEALARVLDRASPQLLGELTEDELLGHLLVLHELHPDPADRRAEQAVERLRPALREHGGDAELVGVRDGVASVRVRAKGCCSSTDAMEEAVREAVLAAAPELSEVRPVAEAAPAPAFVPLEAVLPRRAGAGGAA